MKRILISPDSPIPMHYCRSTRIARIVVRAYAPNVVSPDRRDTVHVQVRTQSRASLVPGRAVILEGFLSRRDPAAARGDHAYVAEVVACHVWRVNRRPGAARIMHQMPVLAHGPRLGARYSAHLV